MKNLFLSLLAVGFFVLAVGIFTKTLKGEQTILTPYLKINTNATPTPTGLKDLKEITVGKTVVMANIADTNEERAVGLGGISSLPMSQGMLFVFPTKGVKPSFWMKDMKIPLDFIWISNGVVTQIDTNIPAPNPNTPDKDLKTYTPLNTIDYILEVNAGFVQKNNIKVGDVVMTNL